MDTFEWDDRYLLGHNAMDDTHREFVDLVHALLTVGEQDFRVPLNNSLEYWSALQRMQVPSKLIVFPEENHWILKGEDSRFWYTEVQDWLAKYLLQ